MEGRERERKREREREREREKEREEEREKEKGIPALVYHDYTLHPIHREIAIHNH